MIEDKVIELFDANRILSNERLDAIIADTMRRITHGRVELTDEEAESLAAAGDSLIRKPIQRLTDEIARTDRIVNHRF